MTYGELYRQGCAALNEAGVPDAETDARLLLLEAAGMTPSALLCRRKEEVQKGVRALAEKWYARRAGREPLQYIIGSAPFFGHSFFVGKGVLIPRFDTEIVVQEVLRLLPQNGKLLEIGVGSGCILLSVLAKRMDVSGVGVDRFAGALFYARRNRARLGIDPKRAALVRGDLFENQKGKYDIIVSNPPYVAQAEMERLEKEVKDFEPEEALCGGADGLDFYRKLTKEAGPFLCRGGFLVVEIGFDQGERVRALFERNGFLDVCVKKDFGGKDRLVSGKRDV